MTKKWNGAQRMDIEQDRREKARRDYAKKADTKMRREVKREPLTAQQISDGWKRF